MTLDDILKTSPSSDYYEEDAQDYLEENQIPLKSHNRNAIYRQAWKAGWRPQKDTD